MTVEQQRRIDISLKDTSPLLLSQEQEPRFSTHKEIEAKYFVAPDLLEHLIAGVPPFQIEQYYLSIEESANTRIRKTVRPYGTGVQELYEYTSKEVDPDDGEQWESTIPLSADIFEAYAQESMERGFLPVRKIRYETEWNGHICHVDVFGDDTCSFTVVEIEFGSKKAKKKFSKNLPDGFIQIPAEMRQGAKNTVMARHGIPFWARV